MKRMIQCQTILEDAEWFTVILGREQPIRSIRCHSVVDVNADGQWVHGIEIFLPPFDLLWALAWLQPVPPGQCREPGCVTYDEEADAAYLYLLYRDGMNPKGDRFRIARSCEVEAEWRLSEDGSVMEIGIPRGADSGCAAGLRGAALERR